MIWLPCLSESVGCAGAGFSVLVQQASQTFSQQEQRGILVMRPYTRLPKLNIWNQCHVWSLSAGEAPLYIAALRGNGHVVALLLSHFHWKGIPWQVRL